jgi:hypothetical protein
MRWCNAFRKGLLRLLKRLRIRVELPLGLSSGYLLLRLLGLSDQPHLGVFLRLLLRLLLHQLLSLLFLTLLVLLR